MNKASPIDVFLHIPKTAGTSFNTFLTRQYGRHKILHAPDSLLSDGGGWFNSLDNGSTQRVELLRGHILYGIHNHIERPVNYFTILRDPLRRIQSFLNHMASEAALRHQDTSPWLQAVRCWSDAETYIGKRPYQVDNHMVRVISGMDFEPGECSNRELEVAMQNLERIAFGVQEHLNESLLLLSKKMRWSAFPVLSKTKSDNLHRIKLNDRDIQRFENLNTYDRVLFSYAKKKLLEEATENKSIVYKAMIYRNLTPSVTWLESLVRSILGKAQN